MKPTVQSEMEAIPVSSPSVRPVRNPATLQIDMHLSYDAEVQYKRKDNEVRLILCSTLDQINVGEPVMITYHTGMRAYKHNRRVVVSNNSNCFGGFYYTNGRPA